MSKSEAVVIESIEVRELLRFLFYLDILKKLSLLQRKHSKYMYARCLNFPCFINYLAACILNVLPVRLTRVVFERRDKVCIETKQLSKKVLNKTKQNKQTFERRVRLLILKD